MDAPARRHSDVIISITLTISVRVIALSTGRTRAQEGRDRLLTDRHYNCLGNPRFP